MKNSIFFVLVLAVSIHCFSQKINFNKLESTVKEAVKTFDVTGLSVGIVKDGEFVFQSNIGYANASEKDELNNNDVFNIASCSKAFTAACIAKLVDEGKLDWKDKVTKYIPYFELGEKWVSDELTITDLLCHRTTLGTFYGDLLWYNTDYTDEEIVQRMKYLPQTKEFRSEFGYQNNMFLIAGMIVEKVTGKSWSQYVQDEFFTPLNMNLTRPSNDELKLNQEIAMPHIEGKLQPLYDFNGTKPAASIYSNVSDLSNWVKMWLNEGRFGNKVIIPSAQINKIFSAHTVMPVGAGAKMKGQHFSSYGLGWSLSDYAGAKVVEHNGGMPGYISKVLLVPEKELGIIILNNNLDFFVNDALKYTILDLYLKDKKQQKNWVPQYAAQNSGYQQYKKANNEKRLAARKKGTKPSLKKKTYVGMYEDKMYGKAEVKLDGKKLSITLLPAKEVFTGELSHWHDDSYKVEFKDDFLPFGLINFEIKNEKVEGFKIDLPNDDFHFFNLNFRRL